MLELCVLVVFVCIDPSKPQTIEEQVDWCSKQFDCVDAASNSSYKNTMCTYDEASSKRHCRDMADSMTPVIKYVLLAMHNTFRNKIAQGGVEGWPSAADMKQLTWDNTLSQSALRWAYQCMVGNDNCRKTPQYPTVGQNKGTMDDSRRHVNVWEIFSWWISEASKASSDILKHYRYSYSYHHFTNVAWARTSKIGCGVINHTRLYGSRTRFSVVLACNMAPAGNVESMPMYTEGRPCSRCDRGTSCNQNSTYRYLCASPTDPADEGLYEVPIEKSIGWPTQPMSAVFLVNLFLIFLTF